MDLLTILLSCIISGVSFFVFRTRILYFLKQKELVQQNYRGNPVLSSGGLLILIPCLLAALLSYILKPTPIMTLFAIMMPALAFCGMLDDLLGDSSSKGLTGHIGAFFRGSFSTGFLKALIGGLIGFYLAWFVYSGLLLMITDILLFSLSVNLINLLDIRPGRAIKGFAIILFLIAASTGFTDIYFILPAAVVLVFYTGGEMDEVYMLGDTGANLLGGIMGFYEVLALEPAAKGLLLALLFSSHLLSEFHSLSIIIDKVPLLKKLDMLGRKREER